MPHPNPSRTDLENYSFDVHVRTQLPSQDENYEHARDDEAPPDTLLEPLKIEIPAGARVPFGIFVQREGGQFPEMAYTRTVPEQKAAMDQKISRMESLIEASWDLPEVCKVRLHFFF